MKSLKEIALDEICDAFNKIDDEVVKIKHNGLSETELKNKLDKITDLSSRGAAFVLGLYKELFPEQAAETEEKIKNL